MINKPKVSVIVVTHDAYADYLPRALTSLKQQSVSDYEVIVVENTGQNLSKGANRGIRQAKGKYIVRVDADDWVDGELLELEANYLDEHKEIDCIWCDYLLTDFVVKHEAGSVFHVEPSPQYTLEHACGAMFRKSVWRKLGGYDDSLRYQEAYDFWARFNKSGYQAKRLEVPMYYYYRHAGSMSTNTQERAQVRAELDRKHNVP